MELHRLGHVDGDEALVEDPDALRQHVLPPPKVHRAPEPCLRRDVGQSEAAAGHQRGVLHGERMGDRHRQTAVDGQEPQQFPNVDPFGVRTIAGPGPGPPGDAVHPKAPRRGAARPLLRPPAACRRS
eukprot:TRINITY_DN8947_c0_g1_i1.p2 TRINITY_DN8947_c0_g1~~TRINITY_DN8947_c0_g1_i1.p2  ORF type:complete len:127 (+),score=13.32 TRINITY_DN8947_c0_g1_i1:174-554(+)